MVLLMTVEPGFGGQKFLDLVLPKIRRTRELMDRHGVETWLQVDGGVSLETIERCARPGPTCSSRAPPSSPPTTPTRWSTRCASAAAAADRADLTAPRGVGARLARGACPSVRADRRRVWRTRPAAPGVGSGPQERL